MKVRGGAGMVCKGMKKKAQCAAWAGRHGRQAGWGGGIPNPGRGGQGQRGHVGTHIEIHIVR